MARITEEFAQLVNAATMENVSTPFFTNKKNVRSIGVSKLPINKAVFRFENLLSKYLVNFANSVQNQPQSNLSILALENDLNATLRLHAQQIYWLGAIYVGAFNEVKPILTARDLDNIKDISDRIKFSIWKRIDKFFVREKVMQDDQTAEQVAQLLKQGAAPKALKPIFKPDKHAPLNLDKQFKGLATVLATSALNIGTIDKALQITEGIQKGQIINPRHVELDKIATASIMDSFKSFADKVKQVEFRIKKGLQLTPEVIWITYEDDLVCAQCNALNGETYLLGDPTKPKPIRDTHDNCRCRLLLVDPDGDRIFAA